MENYNKVWTQFETHALAFSLLRKNLYPNYWIRGDYKLEKMRGDIVIFKPLYMKPPVLKLIIQVKASDSSHTKAWNESHQIVGNYEGVPVIEIIGGEAAYNIRNIVAQHL